MNTQINITAKNISSFFVIMMAAGLVTACGDVDNFPGTLKTDQEKHALDKDQMDENVDQIIDDYMIDLADVQEQLESDREQLEYIEELDELNEEQHRFDIPENIDIRNDFVERTPFQNGCGQYGEWKEMAYDTCDKFGGELIEIEAFDACEGGVKNVSYACEIEDENGDVRVEDFTSGTLGGEASCKSYQSFKAYASESCGAGELIAIQTGKPCAPESSEEHASWITYTCQS